MGDSNIQIDSGKGDCIIIIVDVNKEKKKKTKTINIMTEIFSHLQCLIPYKIRLLNTENQHNSKLAFT